MNVLSAMKLELHTLFSVYSFCMIFGFGMTVVGENFIHQAAIDGFECTSSYTIEFGVRPSKLSCSSACTMDSSCVSFFYNAWDRTCNGSRVVTTSTNSCDQKTGTVYYTQDSLCEAGWIVYEGHCYKLISTPLTWAQAQSTCIGYGAYLMSIESESESQFGIDTFSDGGVWIGGNDGNVDSVWKWESGEDFVYTNWDPGEPSSSTHLSDCMRVREFSWKWHDQHCANTYGCICEKNYSLT